MPWHFGAIHESLAASATNKEPPLSLLAGWMPQNVAIASSRRRYLSTDHRGGEAGLPSWPGRRRRVARPVPDPWPTVASTRPHGPGRLRPSWRRWLYGPVIPVERGQSVSHRAAVRSVYEFRAGGPIGCDCGFAQIHRLGDGQTEPFRAMKRNKAIAGCLQGVDVPAREGFGDDDGAPAGRAGSPGGR